MNVRKRPRLELELNSASASAAPPALLTTTAHTADLSEALLSSSTFGSGSGGQSLILTSAGNALLNSSSGAQIFLTICGDENSEDGDESQEYYAIKQEPGSDLDVHTLLPTNLQLPTGCEIYLVKDTSLASQPKTSIKLEPELLSEKMVASRPVTLSVAATPAPVAATAPASSATSVLYGQTQRSVPEVLNAATSVNASIVPTTPASKLDAYKKRDDKRRATHNEVERRRRDKINSWIFKLKEMLPSLSSNGLSTGEISPSPSTSTSTSTSCSAKSNLNPNPNPSPSGRTPPNDSKSQILIKACEYIKSMQGEIDTLRDCLREADGLRASNQALREELDRLKRQQQMQERFHTAASTRSTFNVTLNSLNSSATSDLFEGIDTTPNLAAVSSLGFGKRGLLISDYDE
ncbi:uncharacterized protein LOC110181755 [Drosophila serrata]|uniref:uncharacterized protein LOC110181755 n=1 Tax=Drosophila serrata TaxID=7274 RepID=UPI000A1CF8CE|nr:uncharacterized protein LOC110181755 [Drosophila serrata]KAH8376323.1 hypothetical protein KR200_008069 [Drosophila serrata]